MDDSTDADATIRDLRAQVADAEAMHVGLVEFGRRLETELGLVNTKIAMTTTRTHRRALHNQARTIEHVIAMYNEIDGTE